MGGAQVQPSASTPLQHLGPLGRGVGWGGEAPNNVSVDFNKGKQSLDCAEYGKDESFDRTETSCLLDRGLGGSLGGLWGEAGCGGRKQGGGGPLGWGPGYPNVHTSK